MNRAEPLWSPSADEVARAQLTAFIGFCAVREGRAFASWQEFHRWSVEEYRTFWAHFITWSGLRVEGTPEPATTSDDVESARFFPGLRLSFTANVLDGLGATDDAIAIVECHEEETPREVTRGALRSRVNAAARALRALGIAAGDRVVGLVAHDADTAALALATAGLGATWSSCGPELAADAVIARFAQLDPALLVVTAQVRLDGTTHDLLPRARRVAESLPTLRATIVTKGAEAGGWPVACHALETLVTAHAGPAAPWATFPFDHPLYVLYSSGTTGPPKAIVHGAGGTLIEHLKEHRLHGDLGPRDRLYFQTSCGWMMWHWTLSALATGAAMVTYDGSVAVPGPDALWRLVATTRTTVLGASPALVQFCREAAVVPKALDLSHLRAFLSTGSILGERDFEWVASQVGPIPVQSISGGTDIIGCFVLGNPCLPVWAGESQCVSLAMDARAEPSPDGGPAELVCGRPFPSRPVSFIGDTDGSRRHAAYFAERPGLWTHGDFIALSPRGSARILGRSDGVLKVRGVRIGPAEITGIVLSFAEVREAMAVEQRAPREPGGSRIVLLLVLAEGVTLDRGLTHRLKRAIRDRASADHVPAVIVPLPALPVTLNGKRSERAARDTLNGGVAANAAALRNPEVLDLLRDRDDLRPD